MLAMDEYERVGLVRLDGIVQLPLKYKGIQRSYNGWVEIRVGKKFGIADDNGKWLIKPKFDWLEKVVKDGYSIVKLDDKYGIIDKKGKYTVKPKFEEIKYIEGRNDLFIAKEKRISGSKTLDG